MIVDDMPDDVRKRNDGDIIHEISPDKFYGMPSGRQIRMEAALKKDPLIQERRLPRFMTDILGPSRTWRVFRKQEEALKCSRNRQNGLMCFTYEQSDGVRLFLTAHPLVFWHVYSNRPANDRRSYEIIQENTACKLYLDIEFELAFNPNSNGPEMLAAFLKLMHSFIKEQFNVSCTNRDVLDLDSSNSTKYSHHIIYQLLNTAFQDNYSVGNFVKYVCSQVKYSCLTGSEETLAASCGISVKDVQSFFVNDRKGNKKLFCDEGVYTKNRHFRILGSSKFNKNTALVVSETNEYHPTNMDQGLFLDSLITYFPQEAKRILDFGSSKEETKGIRSTHRHDIGGSVVAAISESHKEVDAFIKSLVAPGVIRRKTYFNSSSTIVYDIQGFRYCENIGRHHRRNNIKLVVDLNALTWFQKCYDPDCGDFRSNPRALPDEAKFPYLDDSFLTEVFENDIDWSSDFSFPLEQNTVPELGVTDEEFLRVVEGY